MLASLYTRAFASRILRRCTSSIAELLRHGFVAVAALPCAVGRTSPVHSYTYFPGVEVSTTECSSGSEAPETVGERTATIATTRRATSLRGCVVLPRFLALPMPSSNE